jgi:hypothetical protein
MSEAQLKREIDERNATELKRLRWENSLLKKILEAGHPLTADFSDRRFDQKNEN